MGICGNNCEMKRLVFKDGTTEPILEFSMDFVEGGIGAKFHTPCKSYRMDVLNLIPGMGMEVLFYELGVENGEIKYIPCTDIERID